MLELDNITKTFEDTRVLNGVSLTLDDGRIMSILGPSGGGKDMTRVPMEKRGFNIVFQDYALFPNLTAYENIIYGLRNNPGVSTPDEIRELIALLSLEEHLNKHIDELSGGQKQRVALARTLVMKPRPRAMTLAQQPATRSSEPAPTRSPTRWPSCRSCCPN
ncbi:ATP-binding cassette domain-containing protein [Bifidobacterium bifidum]|nr:ATP-binding cassette domain-containing protein [Bifidobacterium bifidum]MBU8983061.1 ATP-binding cassette domain-containing protein [Bifidobacterium bifidum]MBU8986607.1 ATP-binding cassette domain-containing protein [Bifidobacterium bifidum]